MKETKVAIGQAPRAVRDTIQRELVGAELEDIARKTVDGQTVYETDVIRDGHKWEVVIREDGTILSKLQEEAVEPDAGRSEAGHSGPAWRDRFDVNKADLLPTGTNTYLTMQPGRVLRLKNGIDTLTITVLPDTQEIDGVTTGILEERETKNGTLAEISRNFFATDSKTGDVYYFGEDVDNYQGRQGHQPRERLARGHRRSQVRSDDSRDADGRAGVLSGDRAEGRDGPCRGHLHQCNGQDAGWDLRAMCPPS